MNISKLENFDCVIMLTFSDWFTEMRSNRFHYAKRFGQNTKVFFIQVNGSSSTLRFYDTEFPNVQVLRINAAESIDGFNRALKHIRDASYKKPLFWVYNPNFSNLLMALKNPQVVYHATEDYFSPEFHHDYSFIRKVKEIVSMSCLVVAVSDGVAESILKNTSTSNKLIVAPNGCDFETWSACKDVPKKRAVVYQGGINKKLDFELLEFIVDDNPETEFVFYGMVNSIVKGWDKLLSKKNVVFKGKFPIEDLVKEVSSYKVGIIPFLKTDLMVKRSLPLKFYEYLSAGLDVVSISIDSLPKSLYHSADTYKDFSDEIKKALARTLSPEVIESNLQSCKKSDYSSAFNLVSKTLNESPPKMTKRLRGILLVDIDSLANQAVKQHVDGIISASSFEIEIMDIRYFSRLKPENLHFVDVIFVHFCLRVFGTLFTPRTIKLLRRFEGHKALFIQDEYDEFLKTRKRLLAMQFSVIYTCVPEKFVETVYPKKIFSDTQFLTCFTGYITQELLDLKAKLALRKEERTIDIFYRGRILPLEYGSLGYQKYIIGKHLKELLIKDGRDLSSDIEVDDSLRIYGNEWYVRLLKSKTMLGTESGSNVFDFDGKLSQCLQELRQSNMELKKKIEVLSSKYEGLVEMNQVSPKIFEMFASGCVPILFKGNYSGLITPNDNYISLEHDFSNLDEVLKLVKDNKELDQIRENNFRFIENRKDVYFENFVGSKVSDYLNNSIVFYPKKNEEKIYLVMRENLSLMLSPTNVKNFIKRSLVISLKRTLMTSSKYFKFDPDQVYDRIKSLLA